MLCPFKKVISSNLRRSSTWSLKNMYSVDGEELRWDVTRVISPFFQMEWGRYKESSGENDTSVLLLLTRT